MLTKHMREMLSVALLFVVLLTSGCGALRIKAPVVPPRGFLYTRYSAPLTTDFDRTPVCEKKGEATSRYVFWYVMFMPFEIAWDPAAIQEAAKNGDITEICYADYEYMNVLGLYAHLTVRAYGR